jgi:hypothetical protein
MSYIDTFRQFVKEAFAAIEVAKMAFSPTNSISSASSPGPGHHDLRHTKRGQS